MNNPPPSPRRTYPLSALFVLTAVCGVITALLTPIISAVSDGSLHFRAVFWAAVAGVAFMTVLGVVIGLFHHRRLAGAGIGALTGFILGPAIGPLVLVPTEELPRLFVVAVGGSFVLVAASTILRLMSSRDVHNGHTNRVGGRPPANDPFARDADARSK